MDILPFMVFLLAMALCVSCTHGSIDLRVSLLWRVTRTVHRSIAKSRMQLREARSKAEAASNPPLWLLCMRHAITYSTYAAMQMTVYYI